MQKIDKTKLLEVVKSSDFIIIDRKVKDLYFKESFDAVTFVIDDPEKSKSLATYEKITSLFLTHKIRRNSKILAIGGGATSDLAGFVASTILRGVQWEVIPTTLLSMIDASIGGKVGINTDLGKNLIGSFHNPINIYFYYPFLDSLAKRELESGLGELAKYCFLSEDIFKSLDKDLTELIFMCSEYKKKITSLDPNESGKRVHLNLGHTFGHAIETLSGLSHGLCVALGLKLVFLLFAKNNLSKLDTVFLKLNITLPQVKFDLNRVIELMKLDKKNTDSNINFILEETSINISFEKLIKLIQSDQDAKQYFN